MTYCKKYVKRSVSGRKTAGSNLNWPETSLGEVFELGLQEGVPPWHFRAEVGTQHSSRRKQTASQYLRSLPNPGHVVGNGEKLWGCQIQGGSVTPLSLWSGEETEEAGTSGSGLGHLLAPAVSFLLCLSQPQTITDPQLQLCSSPEPASSSFGGEHSLLLLYPCSTALF